MTPVTVLPHHSRIPRVVHIIWMGAHVPESVTELSKKCSQLNPDYEVRIWRDADLNWLQNRLWFEREVKISGKSNIARFEILRDFGGIYLDADFSIFQPLESIIQLGESSGFVVARETKAVFNGAFLASAPGHPLASALVEGVGESMVSNPHSGSPARTGPLYLTEKIIRYVSAGGTVTEVPQAWVYPYFYDRPDLAECAVGSETLLRHEWATVGNKWSDSEAQALASHIKARRLRRFADRVDGIRRGNLKAELASLPEAHMLRELSLGSLSRITAFPGHAKHAVASAGRGGSPFTAAAVGGTKPLQASIRWALNSAIRQRIRGSATYLEVGIDSAEHWQFASRRLDRPGRAIRVFSHEIGDGDVDQAGERRLDVTDLAPPRGSRALVVADDQGMTAGRWTFTSGTPLVPRILDKSRSLDKWNAVPALWSLPWLIESSPYIDLLVMGASVNFDVAHKPVLSLVESHRVGSVICVVDPISMSWPSGKCRDFLEALENHAVKVTCPGSIAKQGDKNWRVQMRAAQQSFVVKLEFKT